LNFSRALFELPSWNLVVVGKRRELMMIQSHTLSSIPPCMIFISEFWIWWSKESPIYNLSKFTCRSMCCCANYICHAKQLIHDHQKVQFNLTIWTQTFHSLTNQNLQISLTKLFIFSFLVCYLFGYSKSKCECIKSYILFNLSTHFSCFQLTNHGSWKQ